MKTTMQEYVDWLKAQTAATDLHDCLKKAQLLIEKEKKQMIQMANHCLASSIICTCGCNRINVAVSPEKYYDKKYDQKEKTI